jgi:hypothetical protein
MREGTYRFTLSSPGDQLELSGQHHAPAEKEPHTPIGKEMEILDPTGTRTAIPRSSSTYPVVVQTLSHAKCPAFQKPCEDRLRSTLSWDRGGIDLLMVELGIMRMAGWVE